MTTQVSQMTREQLEAWVAKLQSENAQIKEDAARKLSLKVGEKGTICLNHGGRYPVALYLSQWERIIPFIKSGAIERFAESNRHLLSLSKGDRN